MTSATSGQDTPVFPNREGEFPLEPKVKAARLAAGIATIILALILKTIPFLAGWNDLLLEILTDILLGVGALLATWWAGWKAKHVQRVYPQAKEPHSPQ